MMETIDKLDRIGWIVYIGSLARGAFTGDICAAGMNRGIRCPLFYILQMIIGRLNVYYSEKVDDRRAWGVASHHSPWD